MGDLGRARRAMEVWVVEHPLSQTVPLQLVMDYTLAVSEYVHAHDPATCMACDPATLALMAAPLNLAATQEGDG
jgi:hypothetical protein